MCPFAQMVKLKLSVSEYFHPLSVAGIYILVSVMERVQRNLDSVCLLRPLKSLSRSTVSPFHIFLESSVQAPHMKPTQPLLVSRIIQVSTVSVLRYSREF